MRGLIKGLRVRRSTPLAAETAVIAPERRSPGRGSVVLIALWLGILVGATEVGSLVAVRRLTGTITYEVFRTNWHYAWMIPVSYALFFGTLGLALELLRIVAPRWFTLRTTAYLLAFPTTLAVAMAVPRAHSYAMLALSLGVTARLGPAMVARIGGLERLVHRTLPAMAVVFLGLVAWQWLAVSNSEKWSLASLPKASPGAPNVMLIVLDTVRFDGVFPTPPARDPTPFLTRLSKQGIRFDEARSTAPWTLPSHASMFTGRWSHELSTALSRPLDDSFPTLAEHLADQGYAPAAFMANTHNGNAWYGLDRGFARYEDHYENTSVNALELLRSSRFGNAFLMSKIGQNVVTSLIPTPKYMYRKSAAMINCDALTWIGQSRERPFFTVLNYYDAHDPYVPPPGVPRPFSSRYGPNDPRPLYEKARDAYDDCLSYLDSQLEILFGELESRGILKNTVVIITADHGEQFGEHDLQGHGISLYRQELHVPLLFVLPSGRGAGKRIVDPVSLRDIAPTVADLTGSGENSPFPGRSLARYWTEEDTLAPPSPLLAEVEAAIELAPHLTHAPTGRGKVRSVITDGHVFIRNGDGEEELYDLDEDLNEAKNQVDLEDQVPPVDHYRRTLDRLLNEPEAIDRRD